LEQFVSRLCRHDTVSRKLIELERRTDRERKLAYPDGHRCRQLNDRQIFVSILGTAPSVFHRATPWPEVRPSLNSVDFVRALEQRESREDVTSGRNNETGAFHFGPPTRLVAPLIFFIGPLGRTDRRMANSRALVFLRNLNNETLGATIPKTFANALFN